MLNTRKMLTCGDIENVVVIPDTDLVPVSGDLKMNYREMHRYVKAGGIISVLYLDDEGLEYTWHNIPSDQHGRRVVNGEYVYYCGQFKIFGAYYTFAADNRKDSMQLRPSAGILPPPGIPLTAADVDDSLSNSSENPVQNKVITAALNDKLDSADYVVDSALSSISENPVQNKVIDTALTGINNTLATKLDAASYVVDSTLSNSSTNPVQNKVIDAALADKLDAASYVVDSALSNSSTNPVQNQVIDAALADKLDAASYVVDSALSNSSTNPVQNQVIDAALADKLDAASYVVDSALSNSSTNPVQNQVIDAALADKLDAASYVVDSALSNSSTNPVQNQVIDAALSGKLTGSDIYGMFAVTQESFTISVNANSYNSQITASVTKTGYYPLGIVGFDMLDSAAVLIKTNLSSQSVGSCTVFYGIKNNASTNKTITYKPSILWVKIS